jgi:hypothetical protein
MVNATGRALGQSRHVVVDLRAQQISLEEARRGVRRAVGRYGDRLQSLRVDLDGPQGIVTIVWRGER